MFLPEIDAPSSRVTTKCLILFSILHLFTFNMRYRNWDVLLFPAGSKVPIQEFKTQCFVTKDKHAPFLHAVHLGPNVYHEGVFNQLPTLTTFIPSQPPDSPFQVSVHSWEIPRPSIQIENNMGPEDTVLFEARVYIDGVFSA
jgi:hypothetical protein